jgi:uncharacterized protein
MNDMQRLKDWFSRCPGAIVAFSGGVDSSLVAYLANHFLGAKKTIAVISASPSLKLSELDNAKRFALEHGITLRIVTTSEMDDPNYRSNPSNRCYYCKHSLYDELSTLPEVTQGWWILNGTNLDDLGDYRPGLEAAKEFKVHAPFVACQIDKAGVRTLAETHQLTCWDKPASPCLASRIPYGEQVTVKKLRQIEAAEALLAQHGFPVTRVRHYDRYARIEVPVEQLAELRAQASTLQTEMRHIGFERIELDSEGFVSGKLNRALSTPIV